MLITFGGFDYDAEVARQSAYCQTNGIRHRVYDDPWLMRTPFYQQNRWIFDRQPQHGFGFCCWKPYIIENALKTVATGDVVMYLDGDSYPISDMSPLYELAEREGIVLFEEQGCINSTWTKEECFQAMGCTHHAYYEAVQACGRFQLYRKGDPRIPLFLSEWQTYSLNPECQFHNGSKPSILDAPDFVKNSCEQSVLSLLAVKYGIPEHRTPDQNGWPVAWDGRYKPEDAYPQVFHQVGVMNYGNRSGSRFRNVE